MRLRSGLTILEVLIILIVVIVVFMVFMPSWMFRPPVHAAMRTACLSNMKQLSTGLVLYESDYDDHLPRAKTWMIDSWDYVKRYGVYQCPVVRKENRGYGYALNDTFEGKHLVKVSDPAKKVVLFESSNLTFNAHDPMASLQKPGRHGGGNVYGLLDGHAKFYKDTTPLP